MQTRATQTEWLLFGLLGLIWGSSYLFIKIGAEAVGPFTLVMLRCLFATIFLGIVLWVAREPIPRAPRTMAHLAVVGVLSIFAPFVLIAWGELHVTTGIAAVLNATTPLFTLLIAGVALRDEPIRLMALIGLLVGFAGVAVVTAPALLGVGGGPHDPLVLPAQLAIAAAAASYAAGAVYVRRTLRGTRPMTISFGMVVFGLLFTAPLALAIEAPGSSSLDPEPLVASIWLGVLGSGVALLIFYRLLASWGATRTHVVVYLLPPVGIALGVAVLGEPLHVGLLIGTVLIVGGAALTNARPGAVRLPARSSPAPSDRA